MNFTFRKLLNVDANPKTVKGQKVGYLTAVLYMAPYLMAGVQMCAMAKKAQCWIGCLFTAGRGGISKGSKKISPFGFEVPDNAIARARIARTRLFVDDRPEFDRRLYQEIHAVLRKAKRDGLTPCYRLNGTSDVMWEREPFMVSDNKRGIHKVFPNIMAAFPEVQFYDYTKIAKRLTRDDLPSNYHLTLSFSGASPAYAQTCFDTARETGCNLALVVRNKAQKEILLHVGSWMGMPVHDADESDLRFLDPAGSVGILTAKGSARRDDTGFVLDIDTNVAIAA